MRVYYKIIEYASIMGRTIWGALLSNNAKSTEYVDYLRVSDRTN